VSLPVASFVSFLVLRFGCHGAVVALSWRFGGAVVALGWRCRGALVALSWRFGGAVVALFGAVAGFWGCRRVFGVSLGCRYVLEECRWVVAVFFGGGAVFLGCPGVPGSGRGLSLGCRRSRPFNKEVCFPWLKDRPQQQPNKRP